MHQGNRIKIAHCVLYRPVLSCTVLYCPMETTHKKLSKVCRTPFSFTKVNLTSD